MNCVIQIKLFRGWTTVKESWFNEAAEYPDNMNPRPFEECFSRIRQVLGERGNYFYFKLQIKDIESGNEMPLELLMPYYPKNGD